MTKEQNRRPCCNEHGTRLKAKLIRGDTVKSATAWPFRSGIHGRGAEKSWNIFGASAKDPFQPLQLDSAIEL
jgi:hypothetical protein